MGDGGAVGEITRFGRASESGVDAGDHLLGAEPFGEQLLQRCPFLGGRLVSRIAATGGEMGQDAGLGGGWVALLLLFLIL